jgi:hypothetical protein
VTVVLGIGQVGDRIHDILSLTSDKAPLESRMAGCTIAE